MGFFDGFTDSLGTSLKYDWSKTWKDFWDNGVQNVYHGFLTSAAATLNAAMTPFSLGDKSSRSRIADGVGQMLSGGSGLASAVGSLPVVRQLGEIGGWATNEVVKRPLTAFNLVGADTFNKGIGTAFSGDAWRQAYDDSRHVSFGQSTLYRAASGGLWLDKQLGIYDHDNPDDRDWLKKNFSWVPGGVVTDPSELDPRIQAAHDRYLSNNYLKYTSGALDGAADVLADPTAKAGTLARLGKLKYWSGQMGSAATQKLLSTDKWQGFVDSRGYQKTYDFIKANSGTPQGIEKVRQTIFNNHVNGGFMANALADVADDPALYSLTYRSLYGDPRAWDRLTQEAPRIADMTGSKAANFSISQVAKNYGLGDTVADQAAGNLLETKTQAFADSIANGHGMWGQVGEGVEAGGLLTGQTMPRLRASSQWRVGVNQVLNFGPSTIMGSWFGPSNYTLSSATRTLLPSSRGGRHLDLNNPDSLRVFRNNLLQSRLDQVDVDGFVNAYSRATSPEARFAVVGRAEDSAFRAHALAHGVDPKTIDDVLPDLNKYRSYNRSFVAQNKRFAASQATKLAQSYLDQDMPTEAARAQQLGTELDSAVRNGQYPAQHIASLDQDGNLALIPVDSPLDGSRPALLSQTADTHVLQDWGALDSGLWWQSKGGLGKAVWHTKEATTSLAETAMSAWKVGAILRPGYLWRPLTDEAGGPLSVMGAYKSLGAVTEGVKNSFWNNVNRGQLAFDQVRQAVTADKAARLAGRGRTALKGSVVDEAPSAGSDLAVSGTHPDLPGYVFGGRGYQSFDHALADGVISVDDFMGRLVDHGQNGNLPEAYQALHNQLVSKAMPASKVRQMAVDHAMSNAGRNSYQSPSWQQSIIQTAIDARKNKAQGIPGAAMVVDPFSGTSPQVASADIGQHFSLSKPTRMPADIQKFDQVYKYVHEHADQLLMPGNLLHAYVQPDGNLALSVARKRPESDLDAIKPGAGVRVGLPFSNVKGRPLRASGQTGFDTIVNGQTLHIRGAFEGQKGDLFHKQVGSAGTAEAWVDAMADTQKARLMAMAPDQWKNVNPDDAGYDVAWQRAVMQLGNDPAARQVIAGKSHQDLVSWVHNTPEGRAYQHRLGPYLPDYYNNLYQVRGMVDTYLPINPDRPNESEALRQAALNGTANFDHLSDVVSKDDMPQVHGATLEHATGAGWFSSMTRKWTADIFRTISDMPNDTLLRHPFANERYQTYTNQLLQSRAHWLEGEQFSQADLDAVQGLARQRALVDVRKYLYDSMATSDLAKGLRLLVPFGSALYDSAAKWGTVIRENPARAGMVWKIWSAPDRNGMIQDDNGNHLEIDNNRERWYSVNPKTGEKLYQPDTYVPTGKNIVFRLPFGSPTIDGAKMDVRINKTAFQTFLDVPTFGPLVAVPANNFVLDHPEWASNKFVQTFILPYGPSSNGGTAAIPGNVRNWKDAWDNFVSSEETQQKNNVTLQVWATEMTDFSQGKRNNVPTFEEARQKAAQIAGLQFMSRLSGATAQFTTPYQMYVDYYHMLEAKQRQPGDPTADQEFHDTMGPEFFRLTAKATRNALGIPATLQSDQAYKKYSDLMQQFPDLAPLIEGSEGAGAFNKAVYEAQKNTPIRYGSQTHERELMNLQQSVEDVEKRLGWVKYSKFADALHADMAERGLTNLTQQGAEDLAANKKAFLDNNMYWTDPYGARQVSPWFKDYSTTDQSKIESRLTQMRQIVQDPRLQGRDDIAGLIDYLDARDQFKSYLTDLGIKQLSATNKKSAALASQWSSFVFGLKEQNLAFSQLFDRWLTHDDTLTAV